jgi:uncharacterized protein with GYD domain
MVFFAWSVVMQIFVMLTRLAPDAAKSPKALEELERKSFEAVKAKCPKVKWKNSYAVMGSYDYLDIFEASDLATAVQVSALIRTFGHAHTEIWGAMEWARFKEAVRVLG